MKTDLFQSCGHCWVFQICWHIECSTLTASSFRTWNSSAGIPSPSLALFIVMLPKARFTSQSRISGYRSVITPSWLSGSWRSFLYNSSVYSYHLMLIFSGFVRSIPFLPFIVPIFAWNVPLSPNIILFIGLLKYFSKRYFGLVTENYDIILAGYWWPPGFNGHWELQLSMILLSGGVWQPLLSQAKFCHICNNLLPKKPKKGQRVCKMDEAQLTVILGIVPVPRMKG